MKEELHIIVVRKAVQHPYWQPGAYVALVDSDWGPSPVLQMAIVPQVFLAADDAQRAIDMQCYRDLLEVATLVRRV